MDVSTSQHNIYNVLTTWNILFTWYDSAHCHLFTATNKYMSNTTFIIKPNCSYMFRLLLSYPQAVWDCIQTKSTITISLLRPTLFWDVMQCMLVVVYVSGQPIRPIFKGQVVHEEWLLGLFDPWRWDHKAVLKSQYTITNINCIHPTRVKASTILQREPGIYQFFFGTLAQSRQWPPHSRGF